MIHYHGTPLTPRERLYEMAGEHFCVPFSDPRDGDVCLQIGQSVLWDNGAFSAHTRGAEINEAALHAWLEQRLFHPHRAVVLDEIGGGVEAQRAMCGRWPVWARDLSWPVWHLDEPLDYLMELADVWSGVCLGSAGVYWQIGSGAWDRRMDEAFNALTRRRVLPWVHGLRMLGQAGKRWPLASADSTNVARNYAGTPSRGISARAPKTMATEIDRVQCPGRWEMRPLTMDLFEPA